MTHLARKLRLADYFALAFGVMVGTAWLVIMDDILDRGGPLGWRISTFRFDLKFIDGNASLESDG